MKYEVTYFVVDKGDNSIEKRDVVEANSRQDIHRQLRKLNRGCHIHDITAREIADEVDDTPIDDKTCPQCKSPLTDAGECPVCDHGDEEARTSHTIYDLDESISGKEAQELLAIAKEIGIHTAADLIHFYEEHPAFDEHKLAEIQEYRDGLGADFKLKESVNKTLKEAKENAIKAQAEKDKKSGLELDPLNPDDIENVADEYGYDEEETATYKKHYFEEGAKEVPVEKFWGLVCSGKDNEILKICSEDRDPKTNYNRFGRDHSYIMGAIRNGNYSTAKLLLSFGHRLLDDEGYEVVMRLIDIMEKR